MFKQSRLMVFVLIAAAAVASLSACTPKPAEVKPPEIAYGQDMCDECGMLISEPKFAAAIILEDGTALKFDDTGELFKYATKHPDTNPKAWFVHDYNTEAWINAENARFVVVEGLASPMGFGIAAFEDQKDADAFASEKSVQVMTFAELQANPPSGHGMGN